MTNHAEAVRWLKGIAAASSDAIVAKEPDGRITYWSPGAEKIFGYSADEAVGRLFPELVPALDDSDVEVERQLLEGRPLIELEQVRLGKGGAPVDIAVSASRVFDDDGAPLGFAAIFREIGGRKRLEAQMRHTDRLCALGTLAASIAHDMNGPLTYVMLGLRELERSPAIRSEKSSADALASIQEGIQRIHDMARDLRVLSRADSSRLDTVDLKGVLELALRLSSVSHRAGARVVTQFDDVPSIRGDAARLAQVFMNVLINAADALAGVRDRERVISLDLRERGGRALVTITDNGPGMPPEVADRAFEPFFTTKPAGLGTGLGLAISRSIVEELGGFIEIASTVGKGTTVGVLLPTLGEQALDSPVTRTRPTPTPRTSP